MWSDEENKLDYQTTLKKPPDAHSRQAAIHVSRRVLWLLDHWVLVFSLLFGLFWVTPFLAPVFMRLGWTGPANVIYLIYSTQCHQMAQRSFFLFGPQFTYNIAQLPVQMLDNEAANMLILRGFIGNSDLGWKVAWSDRMAYMYGALWLASIAFGLLRHRRQIQPLSLLKFGLLMLPMMIDGGTHWLSDFSGGLAEGWRYSNQWLANLTGNALPTWFYAGDALGSFNSWARLLSGLTFGVAVVWLAFPYIDQFMTEAALQLRAKVE